MRSLPFVIDELNGGFMILEGILRVEKGKLHIEFQKKDNLLGAYKSDLRAIEIELTELSMMEFKKGFFFNKLLLHSKRAAAFKDLPGDELTTRKLKIKRKHREIAANISSNVNLLLSEQRLNELKGDDE
ncbi:MAG: hypothetical protein RLN90_06900 [Balneolaceae bacterium]